MIHKLRAAVGRQLIERGLLQQDRAQRVEALTSPGTFLHERARLAWELAAIYIAIGQAIASQEAER